MYEWLHGLLCDRRGGEIFVCFGTWHFGYILLAVALFLLIRRAVRKRAKSQEKAAKTLIDIAFGMYIADFFLMPFAYEHIDIEKLPFHVCTAMCVACFLSWHTRFFAKYRAQFSLLGFLSNLVYLIYPAGVMWHAVHPLCYRVVQTLLFHGLMSVYGLVCLLSEREHAALRSWPRYLHVVTAMTLWAMLGNALYTGAAGVYDNDFNWFFTSADPFGLLAPSVARFAMPLIDIALFFAAGMLVSALLSVKKSRRT